MTEFDSCQATREEMIPVQNQRFRTDDDSAQTPHSPDQSSPLEIQPQGMLSTPILLLLHKRVHTTRKVLERVKEARPPRLYVSIDGPRPDREGEAEAVQSVRDLLSAPLDWECELHVRASEHNLGCRRHNSEALDWFFENEERGIVLEDDCLASEDFFPFCEELLEKYKDDTRIFSISGDNFQRGTIRGDGSYYFSQIQHCWGWASWRRAWQEYRSVEASLGDMLERHRSGHLQPLTHSPAIDRMWIDRISEVVDGKVDSWAYIWSFCCLLHRGLTVLPNRNLVQNIGFGPGATHTNSIIPHFVVAAERLEWPLKHPTRIEYDRDADDVTYYWNYGVDIPAQYQAGRAQGKRALFSSPSGVLKVLSLGSIDSPGAGGATLRLQDALRANGVDAVFLTLQKTSSSPHVVELTSPGTGPLFAYALDFAQQPLRKIPGFAPPTLFSTSRSPFSFLEMRHLVEQADIVHIHWSDGFLNYPEAANVLAGKAVFVTLHDTWAFTGGCHCAYDCKRFESECRNCPQIPEAAREWPIDSLREKLAFYERVRPRFIASSEDSLRLAMGSAAGQGREMSRIPLPLDLETYRPKDYASARRRLGLPESGRIIAFGAEDIHRTEKGFTYLVEALRELAGMTSEQITLCVFGSQKHLDPSTLPFPVEALGFITDEAKMRDVYSCADLYAFPSIQESFGLTVVESLACGTPVVGFPAGCVPDFIRDGVNGFTARKGDAHDLATKIRSMLALMENRSDEIRQNCRKVAETEFDRDKVAQEHIRLYRSALEATSRNTPEQERPDTASACLVDKTLRKADSLLQSGDIATALSTLKAYDGGASDLRVVNAIAWLLIEARKYSEAQQEYVKATQLWPNNPAVHANLAGFLIQRGADERAEGSLHKVLSLTPDDPDALIALARLFKRTGRIHEAEKIACTFLATHAGRPEAGEFAALASNPVPHCVDTDEAGWDTNPFHPGEGGGEHHWMPMTNKPWDPRPMPFSANTPLRKNCASGKLPRISMVVPSFNQARYLEQTLRSILDQGYPDLQLVVMDGGSTDGSHEIIQLYADKLHFWKSSPDGGQYKAIEEGFRHCDGEIFGWLNSDDMLHPFSLWKVARVFQQNPRTDWIMGRPTTWDSEGNLIEILDVPAWNRKRFLDGDCQWIQQESTFWRSSLWRKTGECFQPDLSLAGDFELWVRFFRHTTLQHLDAMVGGFRKHGDQKTARALDQYRQEAYHVLIKERERSDLSFCPIAPVPIVLERIDQAALMGQGYKRHLPGGFVETTATWLVECGQSELVEGFLKRVAGFFPTQTNREARSSGSPGITLTAIVSVYKAERFLRGCLDDLLEQSLWKKGQLEIIVVDTGSPESESDIVREYQSHHGSDRIRLIRTEDRRSIYAAWNLAIRQARGEFLTNANADDRHHPQGLEFLVDALRSRPEAGLAYADSLCTRMENETWSRNTAHARFWWPGFDVDTLFQGNYVGPHPVWRKSLHDRFGLFQEDLVIAGDYEYWLRLAASGVGFVHVPQALGLYLEGGAEASNLEQSKRETETVKARHWKGPGTPPAELIRGYQAERDPLEAIWSNLCFGLPDRARRIVCDTACTTETVSRIAPVMDRLEALFAAGSRTEALELVKSTLVSGPTPLLPSTGDSSPLNAAFQDADRRFAEGDIAGAISSLEPFASTADVRLPTALGWLESRRGNRSTALRWYSLAADRHPREVSAWSNLAAIQLETGNAASAEVSLRKILSLSPNDPDALLALVRILGTSERGKEAGDLARRFMAAHHGRPEREEFLGALASVPGEPRGVPFPKDHCKGRIVALVSAFNEGDVIRPVLEGLIAEGIDVYLIDNSSTDDTVEQAAALLGKGLLHIERFPHDAGYPTRSEKEYVWTDILRRKEEIAFHLGADWYLHADADEFRESPWEGIDLARAIRKVESEGWNAINYELFNFRPVDDGFPRGGDPRRFLTGYEPGDWFDSVQIKTWKNPGFRVDLASTGGHSVAFTDRKVCPIPFILRHYPIRGETHGRRKVLAERLARFSAEEKARGWHVQYDDFKDGEKRFLFSADQLRQWNDGSEARKEIIQRFATDKAKMEECGGTPGSMDLGWAAFAKHIDSRVGTNLAGDPKVLQEADKVLRGFAENPDPFRGQIESTAGSPLGSIWREIASVRASQARLAGEIHLARGFRTIHGWLSTSGSVSDLVRSIEDARSRGEFEEEAQRIQDASKTVAADSPLGRILSARTKQDSAHSSRRTKLADAQLASIVIPVHNGTELTRNCLDSLFATPSRCKSEIVVVDDASTDGTISYLRDLRDAGRIKLVEHATNRGFAASCNDGAKAATGDVIVFLNNDTIVQPGWLDVLVGELVRDDSVGIVGSRLLYPDGRIQHAGIVWEWQEGRPHPEHIFRRADGEAPEARICLDYPAVTGACFAIPATLFRDLDGFSREFGMYCEDVDLCLRVWDKGLRVRYAPASRLYHLESATPIDIQERAGKSRSAADMLRASWNGRWPAAYSAMPTWMWPEQASIRTTALSATTPKPDSSRPRIGFDARTLSVADSIVRGIGNYAWHHLLAILETRPGCDITILHDDANRPPTEIVERTKALGAKWAPWSDRTSADFDIFHTPDPMHVYPGYASPFQRFGSTRVTATFHDIIPIRMYEGRIANWPGYLARLDEIKECGATLLCNSEFTRSDLLSATSIDPRKAIAVMAGFNASGSGKKSSKQESDALLRRLGIDKPFFLHVGAADPHKNFESALAACQAIGKSRPIQFVVAGKLANALSAMRDQIVQAGLKDVVFTDYLTREELELLYSRAVATLFLSRYEGFGFPALEAMACGCPVIASNAASIPEIVGDAALVHAPDDLPAIAASMLRLLDTPSLRDDLVRRGKERATRFDWKDVARRTWDAWDRLMGESAPKPLPPPTPARTQWISPVWDPSGYGDESRAFIKHLASTDLGVGVLAWGRHSESFRQSATPGDRKLLDSLMGRELVPGRPVVLDIPASSLGRVSDGGVHVGRTTFETDGLPADWVARCNTMDEIWVPCRFNKETFSKAGVTKPILVVGEGVDTNKFRSGLEPLALPGVRKGTTYLSIFEWTHRKGPDLLLRAWAQAFSASDDVELVLRCYPPNQVEGDPFDWIEKKIDEELSRAGSSRSRCAPIVVISKQVPDSDMPRLYAAADVYVAPSRGEGWGRPHMEAMSCGVPVIATRWSGNLEFQNDDNSWLIDIEGLEEIDAREEYPFYRGQKWARPSVRHLVELLSKADSDASGRRRIGEIARREMVERWDWSKIAPLAEIRLREILDGIPCERSALNRIPASRIEPSAGAIHTSIRWVGPVFNFSGYARLARETLKGLMDQGVAASCDPQLNDKEFFASLSHQPTEASRWRELLSRTPEPGTLVLCDMPRDANGVDILGAHQRNNPGCARRVCWTMFESDRLPEGWAGALNTMDEVWVPSEFNRRTFAEHGVIASKIHVIPVGIDARPYSSASPMQLPGTGYTFLSVFQWMERKGYDVLLDAWAKAFRASDPVRLVLRSHPFGNALPVARQLEAFLASRGLRRDDLAPIHLIEEFLPDDRLPELFAASDCFVLPSRGEGWCIPCMEAMAAAKPVIATAWSAQTDYLDQDNSWLLDPRRTVAIGASARNENPYLEPDHQWADPDPDQLASLLRYAFEHPEEGRAKGRKGAHDVRTKWTPERTAAAIAERLAGRDATDPTPGRNPTEPAIHTKATPEIVSINLARVAEGIKRNRNPARMFATPRSEATNHRLSIRWEGSQFVHHSLAHVNREFCLELSRRGHDLSLVPFEPDTFDPASEPRLAPLAKLVGAPLSGPCDVHVRHQWPPDLSAPKEGRWLVIQPWEFGSPPADWMPVFTHQIDELWAYTHHVRDMYLEAGVPPEIVKVVPLGVDTAHFRPDAPRRALRTRKTFKFLFVGGTIARKGFDILLNAWKEAFGPDDDVCLVIKDMGGNSFYKGQTGADWVRDMQASGRCAEIEFIDDELPPSQMPGLYTACDVLVHPYRGEGFGLPIAEAMSCGVPCIVTRCGAADDFCSDAESWGISAKRVPVPGGKVGPFETVSPPWWLEPSIPDLVDKFRQARIDHEARRTKGDAARRRIVDGFTWDKAAAIAEERLLDLASRPPRRSASTPRFVSALDKLSLRITNPGGKLAPQQSPTLPGTGAPDGEIDLAELNRLLVRAEAAAARGELGEAEHLTEDAVARFPHQNLAWLARAMVLRGLGKFRKAAEAIDRAIKERETPEALLESLQIHLLAGEAAPARKIEKTLKERHAAWFKEMRELFRTRGQTWPPDLLKPARPANKQAPPARKAKR